MAAGRVLVLVALVAPPSVAGDLERELGRAETRVLAAPFPLVAGQTVGGAALLERLARLGYRRIHARPERAGEFFYGHESFWIYRHAHRRAGRDYAASLVGLELRRADGRILGALDADGSVHPLDRTGLLWLEPEVLAESLGDDRARRIPIEFDRLPERVWRPLLAAEDARFFEHSGVDARSLARAALANLKHRRITQGGSTLTQQLVKNRELSPKRSLGRKASEAARALWLEAEYDKREILQAYLNQVYYGHVDGVAIHGIGAAARTYFSKPAAELNLAEAALLAGLVQGPNRLAPQRHPERARARRDWVLSRLGELGWVEPSELERARGRPLALRLTPPRAEGPGPFLAWVAERVAARAPRRLAKRRGVVVETTLDPWLQAVAEESVREHLAGLRRAHRALRSAPLSAALVALDARSGEVLAYVGGDPGAGRDGMDRARNAARQPGSTVKPLVLLEAFEDCGDRGALHAASRVADEPLRVDLPSGRSWEPENYDRRYEGVIDVRTVLAESRNVPLVRLARWCGFEETAARLRDAGLELPAAAPPSFVLGAIETSPLRLAAAYTTLAGGGRRAEPLPLRRIERPGGRALERAAPRRRRVVRPSTAYLVRGLMRDAVEHGTARGVAIDGVDVAAKTGSSSELRDAWLAGQAGSIVTVVWVGLDQGPLGLPGAVAAGPLWRRFVERAAPAYPPARVEVPADVVERYIDPGTGLLVRSFSGRARLERFRKGALPPRDRFWRADRPVPVVR